MLFYNIIPLYEIQPFRLCRQVTFQLTLKTIFSSYAPQSYRDNNKGWGVGGNPVWKDQKRLSEILNQTPKNDQPGRGSTLWLLKWFQHDSVLSSRATLRHLDS